MKEFKERISKKEITLTPAKWISKLISDLRIYGWKGTDYAVLNTICIQTALEEGYEKGLEPINYIVNHILDNN